MSIDSVILEFSELLRILTDHGFIGFHIPLVRVMLLDDNHLWIYITNSTDRRGIVTIRNWSRKGVIMPNEHKA